MPHESRSGCAARKRRTVVAVLVVGAVCIGLGLFTLLRTKPTLTLFRLPAPSGPYLVGTMRAVLSPQIVIQLWYPGAANAEGPPARYRSGERRGTWIGLLTGLLVRTDARVNVPVAAGLHPLLIYTPGWGQARSDNTAQLQNLASHGYVVAAVDDTHPEPGMDFSSESSYHRTLVWANQKVKLEAAVVSAILTGLQDSCEAGFPRTLAKQIDFTRVGALGYSFGGAVAAEAAVFDPRVKAAADLDGWTFGQAAAEGVAKPFLMIGTGAVSASGTPSPQEVQLAPSDGYEARFDRENTKQIVAAFERHGGYSVAVDGTTHASFSDHLLLPLRAQAGDGTLAGLRVYGVVASLLVQFFDLSLSGHPVPLLRAARPYQMRAGPDSAVHVRIWQPPGTRNYRMRGTPEHSRKREALCPQ